MGSASLSSSSLIAAVLVLARSVCVASGPTTRPIDGILLDVEGKPAPNVQVVRVAENSVERIENGVVILDEDGEATTTDSAGRFSFGPSTRPAGAVFAILPSGMASRAADDVTPQSPLQVHGYSFIEGTARTRDHAAANAFVVGRTSSTARGTWFEWSAQADAGGHFRIPVIGGEEVAVGLIAAKGENPARTRNVLVPSDKTAHLKIGGGGRLVTFDVAAETGFTFESATVYMLPDWATISMPEPAWPADAVTWDKARQDAFRIAWKATDAAKAAIAESDAKFRERNDHYYYGASASDGRVRLQDVLPGQYARMVLAKGVDAAGNKRALQSYEPVTITAAPADRPDDAQPLPQAILRREQRLYGGDVAPDFDFAGLNGGRVRLSDHKGKFVLVHFWATWCGPCRYATPVLKAIDERFKGDARLVTIHVAEDETLPPAQRYVTAEGLGGVQAWSGPSDKSDVVRQYGASAIPTMVLMGPDGKVRLSTSDPDQLMPTIERGLSAH